MTSRTKMFHQCLFRDKIKSELDECDGPNHKHDDKLFVTIFEAILNREWKAVQKIEATTFQLASYAKNEA